MTPKEIQASLDKISDDIHKTFPTQLARLAQLDGHMATVRMVIDHIHAEATKGERDEPV